MTANYIHLEKDLLNGKYHFIAHSDKSGNSDGETLQDHTDKCLNFFSAITKEKNLGEVFEHMGTELLGEDYEDLKNMFWDFLVNTIAFHDIGKINPGFQKTKVGNAQFKKEKSIHNLNSEHSIISAIIYLQYFLPWIKELDKAKKKKLRFLLFINAYVISRHHSGLAAFEKFINGFGENGDFYFKKQAVFCELKKYLNGGEELFQNDYIQKAYKWVYKSFCDDTEWSICCYAYERLLYSVLVASDFYATSQQDGYVQKSYGTIHDIDKIFEIYKNTTVNQKIEKYKACYKDTMADVASLTDINELRTHMYLAAEKKLLAKIDGNIFFLEAPTGSGKSNTALNLSFQLIKNDSHLKKILYIYPFNTLVEQNEKILNQTFGGNEEVMCQIKVVNSITPIKVQGENDDYDEEQCQKALLDRQFFNYPIALSTHVTLFRILFGAGREDAFSFHQLANSVVVLDEIQSYKNSIWSEIIIFLKAFARMLHMKVIIMSATLPNLDILSREQEAAVRLLDEGIQYFRNPCFKGRVSVLDYSLFAFRGEELLLQIKERVIQHIKENKKVFVEFINKKTVGIFYDLCQSALDCAIYRLTGDDNSIERKKILDSVEQAHTGQPLLLIATQVIEAGVDLKNMDVGFKDISIMDSEEQFLGRINRSNNGKGIAYFFDYNDASVIYQSDVRKDRELSLHNKEMQQLLADKDFDAYYQKVLERLSILNNALNDSNLQDFWQDCVGKLNQIKIAERMQLIEEDGLCCMVYLGRVIYNIEGEPLDGNQLWEAYKELLQNQSQIPYPVFKVRLSEIASQMNNFLYRVRTKGFPYDDQIGELYYIQDGEQYFEDGKIVKDRFENGIGIFI